MFTLAVDQDKRKTMGSNAKKNASKYKISNIVNDFIEVTENGMLSFMG